MADRSESDDGSPERRAKQAFESIQEQRRAPIMDSILPIVSTSCTNEVQRGALPVFSAAEIPASSETGYEGAQPDERNETLPPGLRDSRSLPSGSEIRRSASLPTSVGQGPRSERSNSSLPPSELEFVGPDRFINERQSAGRSTTRFSEWKLRYFEEVRVRNTGAVYGSRCLFCKKIWTDCQRNAYVHKKHLRICNKASREARRCVKNDEGASTHRGQDSMMGSLSCGGSYRGKPSVSQQELAEGSLDEFTEPRPKRRRMSITDVKQCSKNDSEAITALLLEAFIEQGWALTAFDSSGKNLNKFMQAIRLFRPGYVRDFMPTRASISGRYLNLYYESLEGMLHDTINRILSKGFATIVFDGLEDNTSRSIVNVLLRVEGHTANYRRTYFLESVFTGADRIDSSAYVKLVESVMQKYGGMDRICAITSDSAHCCVNERNALMATYPKLFGVQDQAHAADLLMRIPWISSILEKVADVSREKRKKRKLLACIRERIVAYNSKIAQNELNGTERTDPGFLPELKKSAVMLRRSSKTRFASHKSVLEAFLRTRHILNDVVGTPEFSQHFLDARNVSDRGRRARYRDNIESGSFFREVREVHNILRLCRRYLRKFDPDEGRIYNFVRETIALQQELEALPLTDFLTLSRRAEVVSVFMRRMNGTNLMAGGKSQLSRIKVTLLQDVHFSAHLLDPSQAPENDAPYLMRLHKHMCAYARAYRGSTEADFRRELLPEYKLVPDYWDNERNTAQGQLFQADVAQFPLVWWASMAGNADVKHIQEFGMRTLSCAPSSCAAERSFAVQKRIRSDSRNRILSEKVKKLLFCHWNGRLFSRVQAFEHPNRFELSVLTPEELELDMADISIDATSQENEVGAPLEYDSEDETRLTIPEVFESAYASASNVT